MEFSSDQTFSYSEIYDCPSEQQQHSSFQFFIDPNIIVTKSALESTVCIATISLKGSLQQILKYLGTFLAGGEDDGDIGVNRQLATCFNCQRHWHMIFHHIVL